MPIMQKWIVRCFKPGACQPTAGICLVSIVTAFICNMCWPPKALIVMASRHTSAFKIALCVCVCACACLCEIKSE